MIICSPSWFLNKFLSIFKSESNFLHNMLLGLTLCALLPSINGLGRLWHPVYVPVSIGSEGRHTKQIVPQKMLRTKVLVLRDHPESARNHPDNKDIHKDIHKANPHTSNHQIMSIEYGDQLDNVQSHGDHRSIGSLQRFKYSVPVEESSWRPTRDAIDRRYIPLKYLEDDDRISQVVNQAMEDSGSREAQTNLILPIGIKKLHNLQLRRPRPKYVYSKDGVVDSRHVRKPLMLINNPSWRNKSAFNLFKRDIRCNCHIP